MISPEEEAELTRVVDGFLAMQARTATEENRGLRRAVHAKGVCLRGSFEVLQADAGRAPEVARRLARGVFVRPCVLPAIVRFSNSSSGLDRDALGDVRGMAIRIEYATSLGTPVTLQDFSLQSAPTLSFNDLHELAVLIRVVAAPNQAVALGSLQFQEQMTFARVMQRVSEQRRQPLLPYQKLRYWSAAPFRYGPEDVVKYSAWPVQTNPYRLIDVNSPHALQDELVRHVNEDARLSAFEFGIQFLDVDKMTWQGRRRDAEFWVENAAVEWPEEQSPFHRVARFTLLPSSNLDGLECEALRIDTGANCLPDCAPLGTMSQIRRQVVLASQSARMAGSGIA